MVKHNNQVPNAHFHKDWQSNVATWFNQPAKKVARRNARLAKAKAVAPRPLDLLRPVVRCQTLKYKTKVKAGRGFTLEELRAAGIPPKLASTVGIVVDHRRKNRSEEGLQLNVQRLKLYKSKLVIFPKNASSKRKGKKNVFGTDASIEEARAVPQNTTRGVIPVAAPKRKIKARKITDIEREANVASTLRKALTDAKMWGVREKRAEAKAAKARAAAMKKAKGK